MIMITMMIMMMMMMMMMMMVYLAGLNGEAEILEDLNIGSGRVPETDMLEFNEPRHSLRRDPR